MSAINGGSTFGAEIDVGEIASLTDGHIIIGDGSGAPTTLAAFTSSTGVLKVANGGTGSAYFTVAGPSTTRTYTFPDANVTLASLTGTETLSAKTLTAPKFVSGGFIADANGNELIIFTTTASAVNEWTLANGSTGVNPKLTASGETNVGLDFQVKGTGVYRFLSTASGPTDIRLFEDTDNGSNYCSLIAPASLAGDVVLTLPSATGTLITTADAAVAAGVNTGTSTTTFVSPDALAGSNLGTKVLEVVVFDYATDTATGDGKAYVVVPSSFAGMDLVACHARVITAGTTNSTTVQIHNLTQTADMLSALLEVETGETSSSTSDPGPTIDTANDDVAAYDILRIDVDTVSTTAAKGLIVTLEFRLP